MSFEIVAFKGRTVDYSGSIYQADGSTPVEIEATDKVRFKAGRGSATPVIDLVSEDATDNGSTVVVDDVGSDTEAAAYTVRLAEGDLADIPAGTYDAEVLLVDDSETSPADATKLVDVGVLHVVESAGGDTGP